MTRNNYELDFGVGKSALQSGSKLKDSESEEEEEEEGVALELFAGHTPLSWRSDGGKKERRRRKKRKLDKETRVLERQEVGVGCCFVSENLPGLSCCCRMCHTCVSCSPRPMPGLSCCCRMCHTCVSCSPRPMPFAILTESMSVGLTFQMLLEALSSLKLFIIFHLTS